MIDHTYILRSIKTHSRDFAVEHITKFYSLIIVYLKTLEKSSHLKYELGLGSLFKETNIWKKNKFYLY